MTSAQPPGNRLVLDSTVALAGRLAAIGLSLLLAVGLLRLLGQSLYGAWSLLAVVLTAASVVDFGLPGAVERKVAESWERNDPAGASRSLSGAILLLIGATLLSEGLILMWPATGSPLFESVRPGLRLLPAAFSAGLASMVVGAALTGLRHFAAYHAWRTIGLGLGTAATLAVAAYGVTRLDLLVLAYAAGSVVTLAGCLHRLRTIWPHVRLAWPHRDAVAHLASFGGALQSASLAPLIADYAFRLLVAGRFGAASVGIYDIAARVGIVVRSLAGALSSTLVPHSVAMLEGVDRDGVKRLHHTAVIAIALFTLPSTAFVLQMSGDISAALIHTAADARDLQGAAAGLLVAHLAASLVVPGLMLARAARRPWAEAAGATSGGLLGLAGILFLPSLPLAAAWLWSAHALAMAAALWWNARTIHIGSVWSRPLAAIVALWMLSLALGGGLHYLLGNWLGLPGRMSAAAAGFASFVALVLAMGLVPAELRRAVRALGGVVPFAR